MTGGDLPGQMVDPAFQAWFAGLRPHLKEAARQVAHELAALAVTPAVELEAWRKAARGWAEHDGQIIHMGDDDIAAEERAEIIDLIVYRAARLARGAELDRLDRGGEPVRGAQPRPSSPPSSASLRIA